MIDYSVVLFVCSGNFYRSRFAEALFNHHAENRGMRWRAESKGFRPHLGEGDLSPHARSALGLRGIPLHRTRPSPSRLEEGDFLRAARTIMFKEDEHRPELEDQFPFWIDQVSFWDIHDVDVEPPSLTLPKLERYVLWYQDSLAKRYRLGARKPRTARV